MTAILTGNLWLCDTQHNIRAIGDAISGVVGGISDLFGGGGGGGGDGGGDFGGDLFSSGGDSNPLDVTSLGSSGGGGGGGGSGGNGLSGYLGLGTAASALGNYFASANQAAAANSATDAQLSMFGQTQSNLQPFIQTGQGATNALNSLTGLNSTNPLTSSLLQSPMANLSMSDLANTPGYQFNLAQGLMSTQNSFAAQGLGSSGAAEMGAAQYAEGLANSTYQTQYGNEVTNQTNQFNRLLALAGLGQTSGANLGGYATQTASNIGSNDIQAANAGSAAITSTTNSANNALSTAYMANMLQSMYGQQNA